MVQPAERNRATQPPVPEAIPRNRAIAAILLSFIFFFLVGLALRSDGTAGSGIEAWARRTEPFRTVLNAVAPERKPASPPPSVAAIPIPNTAESNSRSDPNFELVPYRK